MAGPGGGHAGGAPARVATLVVDHSRLRTDFPDPDAAERRWWEDWQEAVDAGLATTIALPGDPNDIDALYVTGLGGDEGGDPLNPGPEGLLVVVGQLDHGDAHDGILAESCAEVVAPAAVPAHDSRAVRSRRRG